MVFVTSRAAWSSEGRHREKASPIKAGDSLNELIASLPAFRRFQAALSGIRSCEEDVPIPASSRASDGARAAPLPVYSVMGWRENGARMGMDRWKAGRPGGNNIRRKRGNPRGTRRAG